MDDKITIIEGPPPAFENIQEGWALGLNEGPVPFDLALTRLRTFNGPALVERCHRTWKEHSTIYLEYRDDMGLEANIPVVAARATDTTDGQILLLWVRRDPEEEETEIDIDDGGDTGEDLD